MRNSSVPFFLMKTTKESTSFKDFYMTSYNPSRIVELCKNHDSFLCGTFEELETHRFKWVWGNEFKLSIHYQNNSLEIVGDTWGRTPVFYYSDEKYFWAASHLGLLSELLGLNESDISIDSEHCLAKFGYLPNGLTPFKNISKLEADQSLVFTTNGLSHKTNNQLPKQWFCEEFSEQWLDETLYDLKKSLENMVEEGFTTFAISGGCDSRLNLALLSPGYLKQIKTYTKALPLPMEQQDNDLNIATQMARLLDVSHYILKNPEQYEYFLLPEFTDKIVVSGLYGGEFLGGALPYMLPWSHESDEESLLLNDLDRRKELVLHSIGSSRTTLYQKTQLSWASPYSMLRVCRTPFLNENFLAQICKLKPKELQNYNVYNAIWKRKEFSRLAAIPFESPLTKFHTYSRLDTNHSPKNLWQKAMPNFSLDQLAQKNFDYIRENLKDSEGIGLRY